MIMMKPVLFSIQLRALLLIIKFLFIFILSKISTIENIGEYALIVSIITILVFVLGGETHSYSCRKIPILRGKKNQNLIFTNHVGFVALTGTFIITISIIYFTFSNNNYWKTRFLIMSLIIFFELISQELGRHLIVKKKPISSNLLQLIKGGIWMIPAMLQLFYSSEKSYHIYIILCYWLSATIVAVFLGWFSLKEHLKITNSLGKNQILIMLKYSKYYWYIAVLAQLQIHLDRFLISYFQGNEILGIYSLFQNFSNVIQTFVQTGIISISLPYLIENYKRNNYKNKFLIHRMYKNTLLTSGFLAITIFIFSKKLLFLIGKPELSNNIDLLYLNIVSSIVMTLSLIPHIALYSFNEDIYLLKTSIFTTLVYACLAAIIIINYSIYYYLYFSIFFYFSLFYLKSNKVKNILKKDQRHEYK